MYTDQASIAKITNGNRQFKWSINTNLPIPVKATAIISNSLTLSETGRVKLKFENSIKYRVSFDFMVYVFKTSQQKPRGLVLA